MLKQNRFRMATRHPMANAKYPGAEQFVPAARSLVTLGRAVQKCQGCDVYLHATQGVFGAGLQTARVVMVGEQPGNDEDLQGSRAHPGYGPAAPGSMRSSSRSGRKLSCASMPLR